MTDPVLAIDDDAHQTPAEPPVEEPAPKKEAADDSVKELRRGIKELRGALRESTEAAKFWMQQAQREPVAAKKAEPEPEAAISVDLVDAISNNDHKSVVKALREMGVAFSGDVRRDLERTVSSSRSAQEQDAKLIEDYPDLGDEKSEFFQVTAEIYNDLARDPSLKASPKLSAIAAELADKRLGYSKQEAAPAPKRARAADPDDDADEEDDDAEQERVSRVRRQAAPSGRRVARAADPGAEELDATQKSIVARLREAGANITEEGYKRRATLGVRMAGLPTRRAR